MDKQKMLELFRKEFDTPYYQWKNFGQIYDYIEGKIDQFDDNPLQTKKSYIWYDAWMIDELFGTNPENIETAKRMLLVVSKIRRDGIMSETYTVERDAKMLLRIGYDLGSVMDKAVTKNISAIKLYKLAGIFIDECPEDAIKFTDYLLKQQSAAPANLVERLLGKFKAALENPKIGRESYLAFYMAVVLMKQDEKKYIRYLPAILEVGEKYNGEYAIEMLYQAYTLSPVLKEKLLGQLATNTQAARIILENVGEKEMIPFLNSIGAVRWSYYYCLMTSYNDIDRSSIFTKLYKEDKVTFMQLYDRLATSNSTNDYIHTPYLLSILLVNGEGKDELEKSGIFLLGMMKNLMSVYAKDSEINLSLIADESVPLKEALSKRISYERAFGWGTSEHILSGFGLLYDYSSRARRFIHVLLEEVVRSSNSIHCRDYVAIYFMDARKKWLNIDPNTSLHLLISSDANYSVQDAFATYCFVFTMWGGHYCNLLSAAVTPEFIIQNKEEALALLNSNKLDIEETLVWLDLLYVVSKFDDYQPLITMLGNKSKKLRKKAEELIEEHESEVRPSLEATLPKMKGDTLAAAKRLIKKWDNDRKYGADFTFTGSQMVNEFCADNYDPDFKKYISWIPEDMLTDVRFADLNEKAPSVVLQYLLSEYLSLEEPYKIKICDKVVDALHRPDLQAVLENIYLYWKDNGAEAKKKMIMVPYCIYGSDPQILALRTQLKDWAEASRGAIAAFVTNAIAMNGGSVALMMIDSIGTKFPNNQVKNAAKAAFAFAAKALEVPEDVLSDKIVPTLGFSKEGEKVLDYGGRTFTITLMPDFSLSIFDDEKQKIIKSMPAPGAKDDMVKASAAKKEFSELKKQIKATVQAQTNRLEKVLTNGRRWNAEAWSELFVENSIMHKFATGLIWGAYKGDDLLETFRYMDDGTFNTVDEDEYTLPDDVTITLVHPCELSTKTLAQWKEQLDDYEVVQPLPQLTMPVTELKDDETDKKKVIRYKNVITQSGKIAGLARKHNMVRGEIGDGGSYTCFHWVDKYLNMAVLLNFEYMYMGQEYDDDVTLGEVVFYRLNEEGDVDEQPAANMILAPTDVPQRFVNSILGYFDIFNEK